MSELRVRKGLFGKSILQRLVCIPDCVPSADAGTCRWIDIPYSAAPIRLIVPPKTL